GHEEAVTDEYDVKAEGFGAGFAAKFVDRIRHDSHAEAVGELGVEVLLDLSHLFLHCCFDACFAALGGLGRFGGGELFDEPGGGPLTVDGESAAVWQAQCEL